MSIRFGNIIVGNRTAKLGLGSALQNGLAAGLNAGARYIMTMDADLSHDPADVSRLLSAIKMVTPTWCRGAATHQVEGFKVGTSNAGC